MNGDINFTHTDWLTLSSNCSYEEVVLNVFKKLNTSSLQSHASSLDIFLSNNINISSEILEEKSFSDHKYLIAENSIEYAEQQALPKMKRLNIGKAKWDEFTINFNFPMSSFDSIDNIVDSFYHKLELASSIAIPLKTSRRTNAPFYMSSNSIHLENKHKTALKITQSSEKISRLREELSISLNNDKKHFVEKSKVWSTNDAYKLMRQIKKQQALPGNTWKKKSLGTRALQNVLTIILLLFLFKTILKLLFHLIKVQKYFLMKFSLAKRL